MRRGRPRDDYPVDEFRRFLSEWREAHRLSLRGFAAITGVNRGTISQILHGQRPCGRPDREAFLLRLGVGPDVQARFIPSLSEGSCEPALILLDPPVAAHPQLQRGQELLIRAFFREAHEDFRRVYDAAAISGDAVLQADAAGRLAWLHFEVGLLERALQWADESVSLVVAYIGAGEDEIAKCIRGTESLTAKSGNAIHVLSRALHMRSKILAIRLVGHLEYKYRDEAENSFLRSLRLDERLQIAAQLGHDFRWRAVLLSAEDRRRKEAEYLLSASREKFNRGSLGDAYLTRDTGIVLWQSDRPKIARRILAEAIDRLAVFADARALGPAFCILSKCIVQDTGYRTEAARRYALAGGCLHPYGFVLDNNREHILNANLRDIQRDLDDLRGGQEPYGVIHRVMARLAQDSSKTASDLIEQNLKRMLGDRYGQLTQNSGHRLQVPLKPPTAAR